MSRGGRARRKRRRGKFFKGLGKVLKKGLKVATTVAKFTPYGMATNAGLQMARKATKALRKPMRRAITKIAGRKAGRAINRAIDFAADVGRMPIGMQARALGVNRYQLLTARAAHDAGALDGAIYVVESGDYGTRIAEKVIGDPNRWRELKAANPKVAARPDPRGTGMVVYPGDRLDLPASWVTELGLDAPADEAPPTFLPASGSAVYIVKSGDTGVSIAEEFTGNGGRWRELRDANPQIAGRPDPNNWGMVIRPGDALTLPEGWVAAVEPASPPVLAVPPAEPPPPVEAPPIETPPIFTPPVLTPPTITVDVGPPEIEEDDAPPTDDPAELPPPVAPPARTGSALGPLALAAAGWALGLFG